MSAFLLHSRLAADCIPVCDLGVCRVLLMNNRHFPWLVLVPMRENMRELFDLSPADYTTVMDEVRQVASCFSDITRADKMNIAALGNMVLQLHIHIIARYRADAAWPAPVWSATIDAEPYPQGDIAPQVVKIKASLKQI